MGQFWKKAMKVLKSFLPEAEAKNHAALGVTAGLTQKRQSCPNLPDHHMVDS